MGTQPARIRKRDAKGLAVPLPKLYLRRVQRGLQNNQLHVQVPCAGFRFFFWSFFPSKTLPTLFNAASKINNSMSKSLVKVFFASFCWIFWVVFSQKIPKRSKRKTQRRKKDPKDLKRKRPKRSERKTQRKKGTWTLCPRRRVKVPTLNS